MSEKMDQLNSQRFDKITRQISDEINVKLSQILQTVQLLKQGDTVPFIARYRKEKTEGLDDAQLRMIESRLKTLTILEERKESIIKTLDEQGVLTLSLKEQIEACDHKARLEAIYLPFKSKRKTKAMIAIDAGLKPFAEQLWREKNSAKQAPNQNEASKYIKGEFNTVELVLEGAEAIMLDQLSQDMALFDYLQQRLLNQTWLSTQVQKGQEDEGQKYKDYFDYKELLKRIPSHRLLAVLRGKRQGVLQLQLDPFIEFNRAEKQQTIITLFCRFFNLSSHRLSLWQETLLQHLWSKKLKAKLENHWLSYYQQQAENEAIQVFSTNLKSLLLAAPAGHEVTIGLDPGLRTGTKLALVDETGKVLAVDVLYLIGSPQQRDNAQSSLLKLVKEYQVKLIAIGNGTGSKETDQFVTSFIKAHKSECPEMIQKVIVSEAGASVYSASELASQELSAFDVSLRGAVSIARRLQDPLAELIKIDPKAIGVGQYQHDVDQQLLGQSLHYLVEDVVNHVGVDLNQASPSLLSYISGLNSTIAKNIVAYRDEHGPFKTRMTLKKVPRLGDKSFEQSAGFLRIKKGIEPLDQSAVHPESYPLVRRIAKDQNREVSTILGDLDFLNQLTENQMLLDRYLDQEVGLFTINDIIHELKKPGRDPRPDFKTAKFNDNINELRDLEPGMRLEGTITNVTNFGAFVDIGVHQDGLVHISQLADHYVENPSDIVKTGDVVNVTVVEIDEKRDRISLSMKAI